MSDQLPDGYKVRAPVTGDLEAVTELIRACEAADAGEAEMTGDDLRAAWERARFQLHKDAWVVAAPLSGSGQAPERLAAYVDVWDREPGVRFVFDGYVLPEFRGHGIGTLLVRAAEGRARDQGGATATTIVFSENEAARRLLTAEGYTIAQNYWRMVLDMDRAPPSVPHVPKGVRIRTFVPGQDERAVWAMVQAASSDNYEFSPIPLEEWAGFMVKRESFEPSLFFLAEADDELAGVALCPRYPEQGWVRQVAVARNWRRRGVARALLQHAFREFYTRGYHRVGLVVDSYNRTGARGLYESLGMRLERQHDRYEKSLRSQPVL